MKFAILIVVYGIKRSEAEERKTSVNNFSERFDDDKLDTWLDESDEIQEELEKYEKKTQKFDLKDLAQKMSKIFRREEDSIEKSMENLKCKELGTFSSTETNQWFKENVDPEYKNPYAEGKDVKHIELTEDTTFVRVYDGEANGLGKYGTWMMKPEDIKGLSPQEIKDKFSLPAVPSNCVDVEVKAGTKLRMGEVASIEDWGDGGGIQFDTIGKRLGKDCFKNARTLEEKE